MVGTLLATTLRVGRATASQVGRSRLSPCRLASRVTTRLRRGRGARTVDEVDWFDGIEPDELAG